MRHNSLSLVIVWPMIAFSATSDASSSSLGRVPVGNFQVGAGVFSEINRFDDTINGLYWLGRARDRSHPISTYAKIAFKYAAVTEEGSTNNFGEREAFIAVDIYTGIELSIQPVFFRTALGWDLGEMFIESQFESDEETESNIDTYWEIAGGLNLGDQSNLLFYAKFNALNGITLESHNEWYYGIAFEVVF